VAVLLPCLVSGLRGPWRALLEDRPSADRRRLDDLATTATPGPANRTTPGTINAVLDELALLNVTFKDALLGAHDALAGELSRLAVAVNGTARGLASDQAGNELRFHQLADALLQLTTTTAAVTGMFASTMQQPKIAAVALVQPCGSMDDAVQCAALLALVQATAWKLEDFGSATMSTYCRWQGVTCGGASGVDVLRLSFRAKGYFGHLPPELGNLTVRRRSCCGRACRPAHMHVRCFALMARINSVAAT
jgi:hypothetical protein